MGHYPPAVPGRAPFRQTTRRTRPATAGLVAAVLGSVLVVTGCGNSSDGSGSAGTAITAAGPTVVPAELGGLYEIGSWRDRLGAPGGTASSGATAATGRDTAGTSQPPFVVQIDLDAQFGALSVATDCGVQLGSFSLLPDGRAGVTLAGARSIPCDPAAEEVQRRLVATLGRIDRWTRDEGGLTLTSPTGDELVLVRRGQ